MSCVPVVVDGALSSAVVVGADSDNAADVVGTTTSVVSSSATVPWGVDTEIELVDTGEFSRFGSGALEALQLINIEQHITTTAICRFGCQAICILRRVPAEVQ